MRIGNYIRIDETEKEYSDLERIAYKRAKEEYFNSIVYRHHKDIDAKWDIDAFGVPYELFYLKHYNYLLEEDKE